MATATGCRRFARQSCGFAVIAIALGVYQQHSNASGLFGKGGFVETAQTKVTNWWNAAPVASAANQAPIGPSQPGANAQPQQGVNPSGPGGGRASIANLPAAPRPNQMAPAPGVFNGPSFGPPGYADCPWRQGWPTPCGW